MRRGSLLLMLIVLLLTCGGACLFMSERAASGLLSQTDKQMPQWCALVMFLLAGIAGLLSVTSFRRRTRRWARAIAASTAAARDDRTSSTPAVPSPILAPMTELVPVAAAVNDMIADAAGAVADANLRLKELEIRLKVADAARQHAEAILYSISDAVLVTDVFDELVLANESAARTFDFDLSRTQTGRSPVDQVLADQKMIELIREMRQSSSTNGRRIVEHAVKDPRGEQRTFKVTLSCVAGRQDEPAGVVAVLHDMTKEKEVAEMKNDFVSNVSHELRTPLASIKAYVEMLIDGEAEDERTRGEFYEIIQNEANRLGRLIDNILNISRIESGLVKVNKQPQSLTVIAKEALEVITPQARLKSIELVERLCPLVYQTSADHDMLYQAVLNLLSNAVKYTPEGGTITVQTDVDEGRKKVTCRISDTGVGIPPKDLPFVFDKFYRAEANNRMAKGTGLGLSLVKHIVEMVHQGRIFVESHVGKGSTFGFEMDLVE